MEAAYREVLHRVVAKEKRPQKIHWYSRLGEVSQAVRTNYPLAPMHKKKEIINVVNGKDKDSNDDNLGDEIFFLIQNLIETLIAITIIVRGVSMAYPHSCLEAWSIPRL